MEHMENLHTPCAFEARWLHDAKGFLRKLFVRIQYMTIERDLRLTDPTYYGRWDLIPQQSCIWTLWVSYGTPAAQPFSRLPGPYPTVDVCQAEESACTDKLQQPRMHSLHERRSERHGNMDSINADVCNCS